MNKILVVIILTCRGISKLLVQIAELILKFNVLIRKVMFFSFGIILRVKIRC